MEKLDKFFIYTLQMKNQRLLADFPILQTHIFIPPCDDQVSHEHILPTLTRHVNSDEPHGPVDRHAIRTMAA